MNAAAQTIRIVAFSAIVPLALLVAPILTGQLIAEYGLKPENVGTYFLFELGGISLASLPALWWMRRFSSRDIAVTAAAAGRSHATRPGLSARASFSSSTQLRQVTWAACACRSRHARTRR